MRVGTVAARIGRALLGSPRSRATNRYALINSLAVRAGFRMYRGRLAWFDDEEYEAAWALFPGPRESPIKDRRFVLWSMAAATANLPGDTAECGVHEGRSSFLICLSRERARAWNGEHHLFDSFEGLSRPDAADVPTDPGAHKWQHHELAVDEAVALQNLSRFDFVRSHRGWIPDRFEEVADRQFAFVHVDVDLFQPTKASLEFFYPRLVPGGILLCDDYGFASCVGARRAFDEYMASQPGGRVIHLPTGQGFIIKR